MKVSILAVSTAFTISLVASAAPRIIASTPSLTPESKIDLVFDTPVVASADLGKTVDNTWLNIEPALSGKLKTSPKW
jgi:hypothetical protein